MRAPRGDRERGAAAVEFALVLPMLIVLVFGIISFGFMYTNWTALESGAREGARYMAIHSSTDSTAGAVAEERAKAAAVLPCGADADGDGLGDACTAVPDPIQCAAGVTDITYRMTAPVDLTIPFVSSETIVLTAEAVMRCGG
ncbi:pilus assembly protein [Kineosporiaceae bacterium SCSIO 59966]|nr:pilus assembly protein [Kineosporiaceae bacterium SCSIO 59966]